MVQYKIDYRTIDYVNFRQVYNLHYRLVISLLLFFGGKNANFIKVYINFREVQVSSVETKLRVICRVEKL